MKPAPFAYTRVAGLGAAHTALGGDGAKVMAGNQSLGPMLNLRLARPTTVVDVSALADLRAIHDASDHVRYGAAITHAEIEDGDVPDPTPGWLRAAAANIAHRAVRNRGTLGGSLTHADPAADWVIVLTGLCASVVLAGPSGERTLTVADFVTGPFTTKLLADELIVAVTVPRPSATARWGYWKFAAQVGEFAKASAAVFDDPAAGRRRCVLGALGGAPHILSGPDELIAGKRAAADAVADALPDRTAGDRALHVTALSRALAALKAGTA